MIPIKPLAIVLFVKFLQYIENHKPFTRYKHTWDSVKFL